jgi:hypothetical protein
MSLEDGDFATASVCQIPGSYFFSGAPQLELAEIEVFGVRQSGRARALRTSRALQLPKQQVLGHASAFLLCNPSTRLRHAAARRKGDSQCSFAAASLPASGQSILVW